MSSMKASHDQESHRKYRRFPILSACLLVGAVMTGVIFSQPIRAVADRAAQAFGRVSPVASEGWFTCGMHPWVLLRHEGICPICHMELTPVDPSKLAGRIEIDPRVLQNIGVRIEPVTRAPWQRTVRTVGYVALDRTLTKDLVVRAEGMIQKLYANYEGMHVKRGQTLADFHSPTVVAAAHELLAAAKTAQGDSILLQAAHQKLEILGVPREFSQRVLETGQVPTTYPIKSPIDAVVEKIAGHEGHWLEKGMDFVELADHSAMWVHVALYENDAKRVAVGQKAVMKLVYDPLQVYVGSVVFIEPHLQEPSRQLSVRLQFANPEMRLKPGMFAQIEIESGPGLEGLVISRSAVLDSGVRTIVFVSLGEGAFEAREVAIKDENESGLVLIESGIQEGEKVVVSGQFLLDAESRFRESLLKLVQGTSAVSPPLRELSSLSSEVAESLGRTIESYVSIGEQLADDSLDGVPGFAATFANSLQTLVSLPIEGRPSFWSDRDGEVESILEAAKGLASARELKQARVQFGRLSDSFERLVQATGAPSTMADPMTGFVCGMFNEAPRKGVWLQFGSNPRNPYMGHRMLKCHSRTIELPVSSVGQHGEVLP